MLAAIPMDRIRVGRRLRDADAGQVARLAESIAEIGLLNPITVHPRPVSEDEVTVDGYGIVAGLHRYEACKSLGHTEIAANIVDLPELKRQLAEVDENLAGTKLTPAERALFTRRRKEIYEALHPETKQGGDRKGDKIKTTNCRSDPFTVDTADRTGVDRRTVERDAARGSIGDDLSGLKGTSLDKGVELDALARMDPTERRNIIARAKSGEDVTARRQRNAQDDPITQEDAAERMAAWLVARADEAEHSDITAWLYAAQSAASIAKAFQRHTLRQDELARASLGG